MKSVTLIIGADVVPTKCNSGFFESGDLNALFGEALLSEWFACDFRFFNLETPLCDTARPIYKRGPCLLAPRACATAIAGMKPSVIGLANNHILDHDAQALFSTTEVLDHHGLTHIGAGKDLSSIRASHVLRKNGKSVALYVCAEHEFSIAAEERPGA